MEDIIDIIVTETTNLITITSSGSDEVIDVNIIDNREDIVLNVTPTVVEININSLVGNFGVNWGQIGGTLTNQTDLNTALGLKADLVGGLVPSSQLPSYVDDVVEVANYAALPATGETGKIYVTIDTNYIYRWTGSVYVEIKDSSAVWGAITGTLSNQTDLQSALNAKQNQLNGTGFVKASGTTISYDNSTYLTTSSASSTYVPYTGATANVDLGAFNLLAAKGTFSSSGSADTVGITHSSGSGIALNITKGGNGEGIYVNKTSGSGNAVTIVGTLNATTLVRNGGTSAQFLKADGSVDSSTYVKGSGTATYLASWTATANTLTDSFISFASNITTVEGMGLTTLNGLNILGNYGAGGGGQKIRSFDETTGNAYIDFANTGGRMYLGLNRSTSGGLMTNATAYATVLTTGLGTTNLEFGTNATKRMTIDGTTGAVTLTSTITATSLIKSGGTSSQFLKADGSVDSSTYLTTTSASSTYLPLAGGTLTGNLNGRTFIFTSSTNSAFAGTVENLGTTSASGLYVNIGASSTGTPFRVDKNGSALFTIANSGALSGTSADFSGVVSINSSASNVVALYLYANSGGGIRQRFLNQASSTLFNFQIGSNITTNNAFEIMPSTASDGTTFSTSVFKILNSGEANFSNSIGINNPTKSAMLTVKSDSTYGAIRITADGLNRFTIASSDATTNMWNIDNSIGTLRFFRDSYSATGVGTGGSVKLSITDAGAATFSSSVTAGGTININTAAWIQFNGANTLLGEGTNTYLQANGGGSIIFRNNTPSELMRITNGGNLLVGTTTDSGDRLNVAGSIRVQSGFFFRYDGDVGLIGSASSIGGGTVSQLGIRAASDILFATNGATERMRITSGGDLAVACTSSTQGDASGSGGFYYYKNSYLNVSANSGSVVYLNRIGTDGNIINFRKSGGDVGSIAITSVLTTYNTTSDYRLKEDLKPINGLEIVNKIKVYDYKWKSNNERMDGVMAHELAEILPYAVQGIKDGEQMQSVDYSKIVPVMVQAIKELKLKIETLENK